jgi:hypothetical protein
MAVNWSFGENITSTKLNQMQTCNIIDRTGTRALDTIYQNTTGRTLLLIVSVTCWRKGLDENAYVVVDCEDTTPPGPVGRVGLILGQIEESFFDVVLAVPPLYYYSLMASETGTSVVAIYKWIEVQL